MKKITEKKERSLGTKLFLKAERCNSPKCVSVRRPARPGIHGGKKRSLSEYGRQFKEKQKMQIVFGLGNRQMKEFFKKNKKKEDIIVKLFKRLDQAVFLLGFAASPRIARQLISHGHIMVNGKKTTIASYLVKKGDFIKIRPESQKLKFFEDLMETTGKNKNSVSWLKRDSKIPEGECVEEPAADFSALPFDVSAVGDFYAR